MRLTPNLLQLKHHLHPWYLRHAHIHTTYPLGYVRNLSFRTPAQVIKRGKR